MKSDSKEIETTNCLYEERYFLQRMKQILCKLDDKSQFSSTLDGFVFIFDHGPHVEPLLSNKVLAKIFYDAPSHTLALTYWPHPHSQQTTPSGTIILLDNVSKPDFKFYYPKANQMANQIVSPDKVGAYPLTGWQKEWKEEYHARPSLIHLYLTHAGREVDFKFSLPPYIVTRAP